MKILKYFLIFIAVLAGLLLVLGLFAPKDYVVERSIEIDAPADQVFHHVSSFGAMKTWSPWAEKDPEMMTTIEGEDGKVGAVYSWKGNDDVGEGSQKIREVSDNRIDLDLRLNNWDMEAKTWILIDEDNSTSKVTWGMAGESSYPWNAFQLFMGMDSRVGKDYEEGLNNLKSIVENDMARQVKEEEPVMHNGYPIKKIGLGDRIYVGIRDTVNFSDMGEFYGTHFPAISQKLGEAGVSVTGPASSLFYFWDEKEMKTYMAAVLPVEKEAEIEGYEVIKVPASNALMIEYYGAYEKSEKAHYAMDDYMSSKDMELNGVVIEEYVTDPSLVRDTADWLTNIYYLVK